MGEEGLGLTVSSVHCVVLALSFVQYRTCSVPDERPGKNSAICFQVRDLFSLRSTRRASSSGVNFSLGPRGLGAGGGMPGWPTTLGAAWDIMPSSDSSCLDIFGGRPELGR